jgi:hypothetical protein
MCSSRITTQWQLAPLGSLLLLCYSTTTTSTTFTASTTIVAVSIIINITMNLTPAATSGPDVLTLAITVSQ